MQRSLFAFAFFIAIALAACSSQGGASGGGKGPEIADLNGCRVDPARICDNVRGQNVTMSNTGMTADPRMLEQQSVRTANIFVPVKRDNGDEIFEVECGINTLNQSVSWAHVKTGPKVTDDDAKFLRARGYCTEL
jgi:hypothetical protein